MSTRDDGERHVETGEDSEDGGWLDAELRDSFPASDPLPHWAGPTRPTSEADRSHHQDEKPD